MKSKLKGLVTVVVMACMCVCICNVEAFAGTQAQEMLVAKNQSNYSKEGYFKTNMHSYGFVYPDNGISAYSNYVNVHFVRKDTGSILHCTNSEISSSNRVVELEYYAGKATTSKKYYLAASLYPSATVQYKYYKFKMTP